MKQERSDFYGRGINNNEHPKAQKRLNGLEYNTRQKKMKNEKKTEKNWT